MRTHNLSRHWMYPRWINLKQRCVNPKSAGWRNCGALGITICREWAASFERFLSDVGEPPEKDRLWSLERIDDGRGYEPGNVRWCLRRP